MSDLLNFLRSHTAEALVDPTTIYACSESDPVEKAFQLIKEHNILSVPVKNADGKYTRFVDILDLVECVAEGDAKASVAAAANVSGRDPFVQIDAKDNLLEVVRSMCMTHTSLHRLAVMKDGQLFGILSQSKIVRFFARHISEFDFGTLPISNLNLGISTVSDALKKIIESKVSGLGIVDDDGKLIGNFSATDIKSFGLDTTLEELAKVTLKEFVTKQNRDVISVTMKTKAVKAVKLASHKGVHRVFVVNADQKPIGVISLVDIIYLFFRHILIE